MTDIQLSKKIHGTIYEEYKTAIEFINIEPNYSLTRFRNILEILCNQIAQFNNAEVNNSTLDKNIKEIFEKNFINIDLKDLFHEVRKLGNKGAHKNFKVIEDDAEYLEDIKHKMLEHANHARLLIVEIFKKIIILFDIKIEHNNIKLIELDKQIYQRILIDASTTKSSKIKFDAGVIYESLAKDAENKNMLYITEENLFEVQHLYQLAISHYEIAFKLSADVDNKLITNLGHMTLEEIIYRDCELEALYKYSKLLYQNKDGHNQIDKGYKNLKIASDRQYPDATAEYAVYLYEDLQDYVSAYKYLKLEYIQHLPLTHRVLSYYYSDGKATKINKPLALRHIQKAIALGCSDSLFSLGEAYHIGSFVDKDDSLAEDYLLQAIEKGNLSAKKYFLFTFKEGSKKIAHEISSYLTNMGKALSFIKSNKKIGRNEMCYCGSGKKYKKCCGLKN